MRLAGKFLLFWLTTTTVVAQQTEVRQVGSFKGVKASEAIDVYLKKGDKESIKLEVDGVQLSDVITEVTGGYLRLHMREGNYKTRNVKAYVTYVSIEKISASSASNVFSEGTIKSATMDISTASAATVEVAIDADRVVVDVASAGNVTLEGKVRNLSVEVSSAGSVDAYGLEGEIVEVTAASAGSAKVSVTKELEAKASSGGSVRYRGSPAKANTGSTSGGSVKKAN